METPVEDIVIIGAGIAGLTTSLALHRLGVRSLVLECADTLRVTGFGITTWTNAWKALDAVGVGALLRHQHVQLNENVFNSLITGQQTSSLSLKGTGKHGTCEVRCIRRQLLVEALGKELPSGTIRYLSKVVAIEEYGFSKIVHLANGTSIKTKVLIGCDGVNSIVAKWLGLKETYFTGRYVVRAFTISTKNHGLEPKFMHFFGEGFRSGVIPCDDNTLYWFFTWTPTTQEEKLVKDQDKMKQFVLSKFEKMASNIKSLIESTKAEDILTSPMRYRDPLELIMMENISKGNVCVAGDAFHPMAPDLAQGGCCAVEDGVVLATCLAEVFSKKQGIEEDKDQYKNIEAGLRRYAKMRRWRCIDLSVTSYIMGFVLQGDFKLVAYLRDKVLAAFLAGVLLKKSDFDWEKQL